MKSGRQPGYLYTGGQAPPSWPGRNVVQSSRRDDCAKRCQRHGSAGTAQSLGAMTSQLRESPFPLLSGIRAAWEKPDRNTHTHTRARAASVRTSCVQFRKQPNDFSFAFFLFFFILAAIKRTRCPFSKSHKLCAIPRRDCAIVRE